MSDFCKKQTSKQHFFACALLSMQNFPSIRPSVAKILWGEGGGGQIDSGAL